MFWSIAGKKRRCCMQRKRCMIYVSLATLQHGGIFNAVVTQRLRDIRGYRSIVSLHLTATLLLHATLFLLKSLMEMASGEWATQKSLSHGISRAVSFELTPKQGESLWVLLKMTPFTSPFQTPKHCLSRKSNKHGDWLRIVSLSPLEFLRRTPFFEA